MESTPSSSSNHVVLQRLTSKTERRGEDGELPRIGEDDIDNVIGSCNHPKNWLKLLFFDSSYSNYIEYSVGYLAEGMQQGRREEGGKQQWMMSAGFSLTILIKLH